MGVALRRAATASISVQAGASLGWELRVALNRLDRLGGAGLRVWGLLLDLRLRNAFILFVAVRDD